MSKRNKKLEMIGALFVMSTAISTIASPKLVKLMRAARKELHEPSAGDLRRKQFKRWCQMGHFEVEVTTRPAFRE